MRVAGLVRQTQHAMASDDEWLRLFNDAKHAAAAATPTLLFDCRMIVDCEQPAPTYALANALGLQHAIPCSLAVCNGSSIEYALQLFCALHESVEWAVVATASGRDYGVLFVTVEHEELA